MTENEDRRSSGEEPPIQNSATATTPIRTIPVPADIAAVRRRLRLHHALVRRPRWSRELDDLLAVDDAISGPIGPEINDHDPGGDWWHDTWMDRGVPEREAEGLRLLAEGWVPGRLASV